MKVLFICSGNTGRSQMATELYNSMTHSKQATSAGTMVAKGISTVKDSSKSTNVIRAMQELGIDISDNPRNQISQENIGQYDRVIVMAEPETIPTWLSKLNVYSYWKVQDPADMNYQGTLKIRNQIQHLVKEMIS